LEDKREFPEAAAFRGVTMYPTKPAATSKVEHTNAIKAVGRRRSMIRDDGFSVIRRILRGVVGDRVLTILTFLCLFPEAKDERRMCKSSQMIASGPPVATEEN
jgi:hypothetical protein